MELGKERFLIIFRGQQEGKVVDLNPGGENLIIPLKKVR